MKEAPLHYAERLKELNIEMKRLVRTSRYYFVLRLVLFASFIISMIWIINTNGENSLSWFLPAAILIAFLLIIKLNSNLNGKQQNVLNRININENEMKYLAYQHLTFDGGDKFIGKNPELAGDFDVFGKGSLYQYINRTVTSTGADRLANKLCQWELDRQSIELKQHAVAELSRHQKFMEDFQSLGLEIESSGHEVDKLKKWFGSAGIIKPKEKGLLIAYPILFITITLLVVATGVKASVYVFPIVFAFLILSRYKRFVDDAHDKLGKSAKVFGMYSVLFELMENEPFKSSYLAGLQARLANDDHKASTSIKRLFLLLNRFDYRYNFIVNILFNASILFELQVLQQLERWKERHQQKALEWFDVLAEMDALIGFGRFAFNNGQAVNNPSIQEYPFGIVAKDMGHPLIPSELRVCNSIDFIGQPKVIVITGANMAGKSTFLRTIAVNLILAHNGAPVCASEFTFTPCGIVSSINIHDSLAQNESYFYAELVRIRRVIDHVSRSPNTLVILDEILRGTNPKDKQMGSIGLIEKLIGLNAFTMIATHDLAIGQMEETHPTVVLNRCFEVELEDNQLVFDYKLKDGISKKLNASFLMKKMGIID